VRIGLRGYCPRRTTKTDAQPCCSLHVMQRTQSRASHLRPLSQVRGKKQPRIRGAAHGAGNQQRHGSGLPSVTLGCGGSGDGCAAVGQLLRTGEWVLLELSPAQVVVLRFVSRCAVLVPLALSLGERIDRRDLPLPPPVNHPELEHSTALENMHRPGSPAARWQDQVLATSPVTPHLTAPPRTPPPGRRLSSPPSSRARRSSPPRPPSTPSAQRQSATWHPHPAAPRR
jgi:hypothetical protein